MGKDWVQTMLYEFVNRDLNMLCGLVQLQGNGLFANLQQAESAAIVGVSAVMLNEQQPCTCNGANLMFRRDVFEHVGGYEIHQHLSSGDDDLLMQQFAKLDIDKTRYLIHADAVVSTNTCPDFMSFLQQRSRWLSKRKAYLFPFNQLIQAIVVLQLIAFFCLIGLVFFPYGEYPAALILIKYLVDIHYGRRLRRVVKLRLPMILLMPFYQLYIIAVLFFAGFRKTEWKGRAIRQGIDN
jgi:biofilm PGA synthesis N-glycosyltransferase PgaC